MKNKYFVFLLFCAAPICAWTMPIESVDPNYHHVTAEFTDIFKTVEKLGRQCGPKNVVIAFDLDNTLMVADQDLGSEQWFDWQSALLQKKTASSDQLVGNTFDQLIQADVLIKKTMKMHPAEKDLADQVRHLQQEGFLTLVLTSRGPEQDAATVRELERNGFHFAQSTLPHPPNGVFLPYDQSHLDAAGFQKDEVSTLKLGKPRSAEFKNGVFLTSGQNKGAMLRVILLKTGETPCGIVFVDNKEQYSDQLKTAYSHSTVTLATFRYSREDQAMKDFENKDKTEVVQAWNALMKK